MTVPILFRPEAQAEFDEAFDWYESIRPGAGDLFESQVLATLLRISRFPRIHAAVYGDVRRAAIQKYPYSILYLPRERFIRIVAVFHNKRDPNIWRKRTDDE